MIRKWLHFLVLKNNFTKKLVKNFFPLQIEVEHVLKMFLFFWRFQPGCSYKRCSYKKKKVYSNVLWIILFNEDILFRNDPRYFFYFEVNVLYVDAWNRCTFKWENENHRYIEANLQLISRYKKGKKKTWQLNKRACLLLLAETVKDESERV